MPLDINTSNRAPGKELPRVTVIIRSLGRPSIETALESIACQTHRHIDVLVVDATGGEHPALEKHCGEFPLCVVSEGRALNRPQAGNCGLSHAQGEWMIFLDDDDFFEREHIAFLLYAAGQGGTLAAYSGTRLLDAKDRQVDELNDRYARLKLFAGNFMQMGAVLFHRHLLARGCRFDEDMLLYQDWDFWLQISRHTHFAHSPRLTNNWRVQNGQSGAGIGPNANRTLQEEYEQRVKAKWQAVHRRMIEFVQDIAHRAASMMAVKPRYTGRILRRALKVMPNDPTLTNLLGIASFRSGDLTGAWHALSAAKTQLPHNDSIARNLAQVADTRRRKILGGMKSH